MKIRQVNNAAKIDFGKRLSDFNWTALYRTIRSGLNCFRPIKLHDKEKPLATPEFKKIIGSRQKAFQDKKFKLSAATQSGKQRKLQAQIHFPQKKIMEQLN